MKPTATDNDILQRLAGKRILFALCGFELGGAERQALHLARYLKSQGCDVRVWGHHHHKVGPERVIEQCEEAGIPWEEHKFRWPCGKFAFLRDLFGMWRALFSTRPDVILSYTTWPNIGLGLIWRLSPAKAFIWGQRDVVPLRGNWLEKIAYRGVSAVVCNAKHELDHLRRSLGNINSPAFVVHNGIDMEPCRKTRDEWRTKLGISEDVSVAVMLANFRYDKDHVTLLYAWRKLLDSGAFDCGSIHLVLAGAPQASYDVVQQLATSLELSDQVSFVDHVNDVAGLLNASDIGVLMTAAEGLPNAILEYMASGLAVVATDVPGNREALGFDEDHLLCKYGDVDELAKLLRRVLEQPELRKKLGCQNKQRADKYFSVERMCREFVTIISNLLDGSQVSKEKVN